MIFLRKLNGERFVLNPDLIEMVSENPDTTIRLTNGKQLIGRETMEERRNIVRELLGGAGPS